jgi:hypothetical protein
MFTESAGIISPVTAGDVISVNVTFGAVGLTVEDTSAQFDSKVQAGAVTVRDSGAFTRVQANAVGEAALRLRGDSGGGATPQLVATDYDDSPSAFNLVVKDLQVNGAAGTSGQVLTSAGAGAAPTWETPSGGGTPSDATPQGIGAAAPGISTDYARADHVHAGTVTALTDRYTELAAQTFSEFAHASAIAASPTRDIQTAIDATPVGPACQVIVGPGSYSGATVTIPAGRNNIAIIGPSAGDFGGTIASLSASRGLTIGNNVVRARIVSLQIEGLTTVSTTGAGVHRFEQCQLLGGLTLGAISGVVYVVGCEVGAVTIPAGFTGLVLFDRCLFLSSITNNATAPLTRCSISDSAGGIAAPTTAATINGRWQVGTSTTFFAGGSALLGAPLTAINGLTPAADRIAYYTSASAGAMTALTTFGRSLIDDVDAAAARTTLGLGTAATQNSTAFQAADATLTALAGVSTAANKLPYFTGTDTATVTDITTAGREILSTASSGTSGQVLTSSGGGAPTWTTVSGGSGPWTETAGVISPTTLTDSVAIGGDALQMGSMLSVKDQMAQVIVDVEPDMGHLVVYEPGTYEAPGTGAIAEIAGGVVNVANGASHPSAPNASVVASPGSVAITSTSGLASVLSATEDGGAANSGTLNVLLGELQINGSAGTSGYVLTSNGTGAAPTWQAAGGGGGSGLPTSQSWTIDWRPTSVGYATLAASGWTLVNLTSNGLFADTNGNIYEELVQTGVTSIGYFYPTALTVDNTQPWEMEWDVWTSLLDGFCTLQANEGLGTGKYRWRMLYNTTTGTPAGSWQTQGPSGTVSLSTPYDVQTSSRTIMGMQSEPKAPRAYYANGTCVGLLNPNGCATGDNTNVPGKYLFGNSSTTATAITLRVYGVRVLHGSRGTAPPYARNIWPPVQP